MKKFELKDLMTAAQAQKIIEMLNEQQRQIDCLSSASQVHKIVVLLREQLQELDDLVLKVTNLEKEVENLKNAQSDLTWRDVNLQTEIYKIYKGE